ncbi:hypothetical protein [Qipengyuania marisflavi]|uniref:hypothetical protein n=1 Tax=Qipengyuania marisflavi TaxID=2486356 RepID=UPI001486A343|nr:hypothetical protein [Qipengyuania marisflavi]
MAFCYDANGNLTADDNCVYLYDVENYIGGAPKGPRRFLHDGDALVAGRKAR